MLSRIFSLDRKIKINKVQFRENCFIVLIIYEAINRIFSLWTNKIKFNIILFQDLKYPRRKILWIPRTVPKLLDLRRTINIRALFHHFRIIWNYSKKGKTMLLYYLGSTQFLAPLLTSPRFFSWLRQKEEGNFQPPPTHPFFPSRLFARHFLSLPAGKFSFTSARIRESSTRPRATREKQEARNGREGKDEDQGRWSRERERKSIARLIFTLKRISCLWMGITFYAYLF